MKANMAETYAEWLARKMSEGGFSIRSLARSWQPDSAEDARRSLRRYLDGMTPRERTRAEIAAALRSQETGPAEPSEIGRAHV